MMNCDNICENLTHHQRALLFEMAMNGYYIIETFYIGNMKHTSILTNGTNDICTIRTDTMNKIKSLCCILNLIQPSSVDVINTKYYLYEKFKVQVLMCTNGT